MSKYFIVTAHPEQKSFNHALAGEAAAFLRQRGHEVRESDLCAMGWQPVSDRRNFTTVADPGYYKQQIEERYATHNDGFAPDIAGEMEKLFWCDALILQFPLWWFSMPAILKGWVDKVFAFEKIYSRDKWYDTGTFAGKKAMLSLTTGSPEHLFGEGGLHPGMDTLLQPIHHGILKFCGFTVLDPFIAYAVAHVSDGERREYIVRFKEKLLRFETP